MTSSPAPAAPTGALPPRAARRTTSISARLLVIAATGVAGVVLVGLIGLKGLDRQGSAQAALVRADSAASLAESVDARQAKLRGDVVVPLVTDDVQQRAAAIDALGGDATQLRDALRQLEAVSSGDTRQRTTQLLAQTEQLVTLAQRVVSLANLQVTDPPAGGGAPGAAGLHRPGRRGQRRGPRAAGGSRSGAPGGARRGRRRPDRRPVADGCGGAARRPRAGDRLAHPAPLAAPPAAGHRRPPAGGWRTAAWTAAGRREPRTRWVRWSPSLNTALDHLSRLMSQVARASDDMAASARDLTQVSGSLESRAGTSAAQAAAGSAASEEISVTIRSVADLQRGDVAGHRADRHRHRGGQRRGRRRGPRRRGRHPHRGGPAQSSAEIGDIVRVITLDRRADQPCWPSTQPSRPARAGEYGKGFAVVATEVKELATESARTSEGIVAKVAAAQQDAIAASAAITQISDVVDRISALQATIASAVEEQTATTREMVRNIDEIANGSTDVTRSISAMATEADLTTGDAGTAAATAQRVAAAAVSLETELRKFTV
ncbi:MAG: methyl-accepting chemotaxis protein [Quadrisphaera sp.]